MKRSSGRRIQRRKTLLFVLMTAVLFHFNGCVSIVRKDASTYQAENIRALEKARQLINVSHAMGSLKAGASRIDITPPVGTPLAGFGRRKGAPSKGVLDTLRARALVLSDGEDTLALVSLDLMAVHKELFDTIAEKVKDRFKIGAEDLFLIATHTHSGTGGLTHRWAYERVSGKFNKEIFTHTADQIAEGINEAIAKTQTAKIGLGSKLVSEFSENRMNQSGPVDPELAVLRVDNERGEPLGILANFAAHPTILGASNFYFSADFPGFMTAKVEEAFPTAVCLFTNGAAADLKPNTFERSTDYEESVEFGERLGAEVISLATEITTVEAEDVISVGAPVRLPPVKIRSGWLSLPAAIGGRFFLRDTFMNSARIGNILLFSIPGELSVEIGLKIKQEVANAGLNAIILGYSNDYIAYILTEEGYRSGEYESRVSFYGPKLGSTIEEIIRSEADMLEEVY